MNLDDALQTYVTECRELLADMETALLTVEQAEDRHQPQEAQDAQADLDGPACLAGVLAFLADLEDLRVFGRGAGARLNRGGHRLASSARKWRTW